jgi:hypothetical protein
MAQHGHHQHRFDFITDVDNMSLTDGVVVLGLANLRSLRLRVETGSTSLTAKRAAVYSLLTSSRCELCLPTRDVLFSLFLTLQSLGVVSMGQGENSVYNSYSFDEN